MKIKILMLITAIACISGCSWDHILNMPKEGSSENSEVKIKNEKYTNCKILCIPKSTWE